MTEAPKKKRRYINDLPPLPLPRFPEKTDTLKAVEEVAFKLARLPPDERAAAALEAFPPSGLKDALWHYARGANSVEACKKAGCNPTLFDLFLKSSSAAYDLRQIMNGVLATEYAPAAFKFLHDTVHDTAMPARVRVDSAKILVDRAGYVAGPPAADTAYKDLQEMSLAELQAFIRKAEAELKDVTPARPEDESADDAPADDNPPQPH